MSLRYYHLLREQLRIIAVVLASILSALLSTTEASAQSTVRIGIEGGINIANQWSPPFLANFGVSKTTRNGAIVGCIIELALSDESFIAPEVRYVQKGARLEGFPEGAPYLGPLEYRLNYIEMVINFKAKFGPEKVRLCLNAAPDIGVNLYSHSVQSGIWLWEPFTDDEDLQAATEQLEFSLNFGAGIEYNLTDRISLVLSGVYSLGLTNVYKRYALYSPYTQSNAIQILSGIMLSM
jgi:hypothetical protein